MTKLENQNKKFILNDKDIHGIMDVLYKYRDSIDDSFKYIEQSIKDNSIKTLQNPDDINLMLRDSRNLMEGIKWKVNELNDQMENKIDNILDKK